ncbi:MAG TPA: IS630 family transposase [Rubrobacteraceae bacterium]|nr:IS630 family transposase [Rubrobacteraceae bacterium]
MRPYSEDLRTRIVRAVENGMSKSGVARLFDVSPSSVKRYSRIASRGGSLQPRKGGGRPPKTDQATEKLLGEDVKERPAATIVRETPLLGACDGQGFERLHRRSAAREDGLEPKKRTMGALERDEWLRAAWRVILAAQIDPKRLVFVDETGTNTSLSALRAWSRLGRRAYCSVPRNRGPNTTLLSSMTVEGMGPSLAVEGATDREVFEAYVEKMLAPSLQAEQVVVMDNLSAHKGARVRELVEERGAELLYLPPYSPDLNPIEEAFAKIKRLLRKGEARTREALVEAMGQAISAVSARDAQGFFEHCGYRAVVRSF